MPARRLHEEQPLDAVANIRMTSGEKAALRSEAQEAGLSISEYGRKRLFGRRVLSQSDQAVLRELRRLGGLVKHVHNESGAAPVETVETLRALRSYIDKLERGA